MLTKDSKTVLRLAGKEESGSITYAELSSALNWTPDRTRRICNHLMVEGYADEVRRQYTSGTGPSRGIALTEKGKHWRGIAALAVVKVIFFDLILPIAASIATTIFLGILN